MIRAETHHVLVQVVAIVVVLLSSPGRASGTNRRSACGAAPRSCRSAAGALPEARTRPKPMAAELGLDVLLEIRAATSGERAPAIARRW